MTEPDTAAAHAPGAPGDPVDDPRPVFQGDWASASGVEKGEHSERVRQWKARNGIATGTAVKGRRGVGEGPASEPLDPHARHADDLAALQAMIDAPKTLSSDRIRAVEAKQRILRQVDEEHRAEAFGPLVELRHALDLVPPEQRAATLGALLRVDGGEAGGSEAA
jgi:hypothetical protein